MSERVLVEKASILLGDYRTPPPPPPKKNVHLLIIITKYEIYEQKG